MKKRLTKTRPSGRRVLAALALFLLALPAHAGELRVLIEGETGVRNDGNLRQVGRQAVQPTDPGTDPGTVVEEDQQAQEVARAALHLLLSYTARQRFDLALGYTPSYERSLDDSTLAGTTHRLDLGLRGALTRRLSMDARERLMSTPGLDLYTPTTAPESVALTRRGRQLSHSLDIGLHNELTRRATLEVGLMHSIRRFESGDLADARSIGADLGAGFHFAEDHELDITAGLQRFSWQRGREANVRSFQAGYNYPFSRYTQIRLEAGSFYVEEKRPVRFVDGVPVPDDETGEPPPADKSGWRGGVQLAQERRLVHWNIGYRHDVAPGYGVARAVEVDNGFIGASMNIGRRLVLGVDGNGSRQKDFNADVSDPLTEFAAGTLRASWGFTPTLRLTGGYSRIWQKSRVRLFDDLSYDRYFLGLAFRLYHTGENPRAPEELERRGEPTDADTEPDVP